MTLVRLVGRLPECKMVGFSPMLYLTGFPNEGHKHCTCAPVRDCLLSPVSVSPSVPELPAYY